MYFSQQEQSNSIILIIYHLSQTPEAPEILPHDSFPSMSIPAQFTMSENF